MTAKCREAMKNYKNENTNYIQMSINISKEIIDVTDTKSCDIQSLPSRVPEEVPRYHVFRFDHTHEGDFMKSTSKYDGMYLFDGHTKKFWMFRIYSHCDKKTDELC